LEQEAAAQRIDDAGDVSVAQFGSSTLPTSSSSGGSSSGSGGVGVLREFVLPEALEAFKRTGRWPASRGDSLLAVRAAELDTLLGRVSCARQGVFRLALDQLPSHLDLEQVLARLPNLASLRLTYGMRHLGMRFDRALFGMRLSDADALARSVRVSDTLSELALPCNMIDDNLLMVLMTGLLESRTITVRAEWAEGSRGEDVA